MRFTFKGMTSRTGAAKPPPSPAARAAAMTAQVPAPGAQPPRMAQAAADPDLGHPVVKAALADAASKAQAQGFEAGWRAERQRVAEVLTLCGDGDRPAAGFVASGLSPAQVRDRLPETVAAKQAGEILASAGRRPASTAAPSADELAAAQILASAGRAPRTIHEGN